MARCPAHNDQRASLSFSYGEKGLLIKCHLGCSLEDITAALGLSVADLFHGNGQPGREETRRKEDFENFVEENREPPREASG